MIILKRIEIPIRLLMTRYTACFNNRQGMTNVIGVSV